MTIYCEVLFSFQYICYYLSTGERQRSEKGRGRGTGRGREKEGAKERLGLVIKARKQEAVSCEIKSCLIQEKP